MEPYLCPTSPPHGDGRGTIGGTGIVREVRAIRDAYVLPFSLSLKQVDFLSGLIIIGPGSEHAYFIYSNEDRVEEILSVHRRVPITIQGQTLRIERAENRPYRPSTVYLGDAPELEKPLDPATSSAILKELTRTVSRFRGSHNPSRVLWVGGLATRISQTALTYFWSRLGCVVDVRSCT